MIGQAVYEQLSASQAVTSLCRWIYPHVIPENREAPAITYNVDGGERQKQIDGTTGPYYMDQVRIDVYADEYAKAWSIADAVQVELIDYRGPLGKAARGIDCDFIALVRAPFDIFEAETELRRVSLQFTIGYEQVTP